MSAIWDETECWVVGRQAREIVRMCTNLQKKRMGRLGDDMKHGLPMADCAALGNTTTCHVKPSPPTGLSV
jgi:hypothetical protein